MNSAFFLAKISIVLISGLEHEKITLQMLRTL